ncbi:ABC transporter ATP-binding protein [Luteimonas soli]|uniref:ABC transporter ATP-binding protein n=1 Tax=Luteimonas soli TaxID=1648966 RepID=A0ABV7XJ78_9GAMM
MTTAGIVLEGISLSVPLYVQPERRARSWIAMLTGAAFDPPRRVQARILDDISFQAGEGDRVAILGRNGAGKSTLLRVLNGVYPPTAGAMRVNGSCQALLNMSLGFSGEATVRENIFLRGTAMRLKAADMRDKIESILEFAGLQEKSSHRLRTLSSGQKMRLGFAISTSVQHDIILMDEWVGSGDSDFMAKATARMQDRMGGSKIVVLASHSVGLLRDICNKGIVLEQGKLVYAGDILPALQHYHGLMSMLRMQDPEGQETSSAGGQLVYGCAEAISFEDGLVLVRGWITSTNGEPPQGLALEVGGERYQSVGLERNKRPDVMRHFGLGDPQCGFIARFEMEGITALSELGEKVRVLGGMSVERPSTPLRVAPAVTTALKGAH